MNRKLSRAIARALIAIARTFDARDLHVYSGILLVAIGVWFVFWPAALMCSGLILLYLGLRPGLGRAG